MAVGGGPCLLQQQFGFAHWFKNQWLPYSAGGNQSTIFNPNAQTYVMRYEDLVEDPFTTLLDFVESTVRVARCRRTLRTVNRMCPDNTTAPS